MRTSPRVGAACETNVPASTRDTIGLTAKELVAVGVGVGLSGAGAAVAQPVTTEATMTPKASSRANLMIPSPMFLRPRGTTQCICIIARREA